VRTEDDRVLIAVLASVGDAQNAQETLEGRIAAIEYIVRDIVPDAAWLDSSNAVPDAVGAGRMHA
jgi:hypothetical protein